MSIPQNIPWEAVGLLRALRRRGRRPFSRLKPAVVGRHLEEALRDPM